MNHILTDRRQFLLQAAALAAGVSLVERRAEVQAEEESGHPRSYRPLMDTSASPHVKIRSVGLDEVRWTSGFWADRYELCRSVMVPSMGRLMGGTEPSQFLENFRVAAGLAEGRHRGPGWNDGDYYKWIEAGSALLAQAPDPRSTGRSTPRSPSSPGPSAATVTCIPRS